MPALYRYIYTFNLNGKYSPDALEETDSYEIENIFTPGTVVSIQGLGLDDSSHSVKIDVAKKTDCANAEVVEVYSYNKKDALNAISAFIAQRIDKVRHDMLMWKTEQFYLSHTIRSFEGPSSEEVAAFVQNEPDDIPQIEER